MVPNPEPGVQGGVKNEQSVAYLNLQQSVHKNTCVGEKQTM